ADGTAYISWVDYSLGEVLISRSTDHGQTYSAPSVVADMLDNLAMHPSGWKDPGAVSSFRTYPYYQSVSFAPNFPGLSVDKSAGPQRGALYMVWAEYPNGAPAPSTGNIREQEPNDSPATAQVVPLDSDVLGGLGSLDFADADYFQFDL